MYYMYYDQTNKQKYLQHIAHLKAQSITFRGISWREMLNIVSKNN